MLRGLDKINGLDKISEQDQWTDYPKFSSWGKTVLSQVIDVEPITVFGMFKNDYPIW